MFSRKKPHGVEFFVNEIFLSDEIPTWKESIWQCFLKFFHEKNSSQAEPAAGFYMIIKNIEFTYHEYRYVVKITEVTCYKYVARRRRPLEMEIIL